MNEDGTTTVAGLVPTLEEEQRIILAAATGRPITAGAAAGPATTDHHMGRGRPGPPGLA